MNRCYCPARAAGRLPGEGQGVRGVLPLYTPRTPRNPGTRKVSFPANSPPSAARRVGRRREPSRPFGAGDVRACSGAPSALRASGIAFAPAPRCIVGGNEGRPSLGRNSGKIRGRRKGGRRQREKSNTVRPEVNGTTVFSCETTGRPFFPFSYRRGTAGEGKACVPPQGFILQNSAFWERRGEFEGEGNPFTRKLKGFPSPLKTFPFSRKRALGRERGV